MSKDEIIRTPKALPIAQNFVLQTKRVLKTVRSFDVMEWEGTPYGSLPEQQMTIYELNDLSPRDGWPTVLLIHGGGWVSGSPLDMMHIAPRFARNGVMACSMQYRLAPQHRWPTQSQDVHAALDFLRSQQVDLSRIALWGFSAGAHLALHSALTYPHRLAAVVAIAPAINLRELPSNAVSPCFSTEDLTAASPLFSSAEMPPTLIVHGSADHIHPIEQSAAFAQKHRNVTLRTVKNGIHGLHWPIIEGRRAKRKAFDWLIKTLDLPSRGSKWKRRKKKNR